MVIPRTFETFDGSALSGCEGVSICIEDGSEHLLVEFDFVLSFDRTVLIRSLGRSPCIHIPKGVEILGSGCFSYCKSLSSISIESDSKLKRIESSAFSNSSLKSMVIPRTVEILGSGCFFHCESLSSISIESDSKLKGIESNAFSHSSLKSIVIPRTVEILGSHCFQYCESLSSISIESDSKLKRIESCAFQYTALTSARVPATVESIASDAFPKSCRVSGKSVCLVM
jgi:hypothetical protein